MKEGNSEKIIGTKIEIQTYLDRLEYAINNGNAELIFQRNRRVDTIRDSKYTNHYTINKLFPDEDIVDVLQNELLKLTINEYIETVKDIKYPDRADMLVFGKKYIGKDVYIKIRIELANIDQAAGNNLIFVMSFHFAENNFSESDFPFRKDSGGV